MWPYCGSILFVLIIDINCMYVFITEHNITTCYGKSLKLATVWDYNTHVGKWTNLTAWPLKWTKNKILFCHLDFTILSHFIILAPCSSILSHWLFRLTMVTVLIEGKERVPWTQTTRQERQTPSTSQLKRLYTRCSWLLKWREFGAVYATLKQTRATFKCPECKLGLCASPCVEVYHTKLHFWGPTDTKLE